MPNFENAFNTVCELVKDFKENENIYLSPKYNESQARKDFIDKFFIALGWDVNHTVQKNPNKQEVVIEQTLDNQSRPDYTFSIEPNFSEAKFYVEAKKPSHDLLNTDYYIQAINYARYSNTPITVLTDFEEFHILDSRYKPNINTVLKDQNHLVFKYNDYSDRDKFAKIYYLFSRDEVSNNSIKFYVDKLAANDKKRKKSGYIKGELLSIDEEFLQYLDNIRVRLAKAFKKADASLSSEELTEATQRTIDRLVFIRFLEDKSIEPEDFVSKLGTSNKAWSDFINICRKLDAKYNGIVFKEHFIDGQNFGGPELIEFKNVCFEFSRKNSQSFNYNLIPIHILGSIYERFLGKVVNATAQRVKVEEKPEVRKAGGVYYTPKYIVDYIVKNTVGKLIENKSPSEISKLRFADIACGSGSFLIGVFETLLDYHNNYYWNNQEEAKKDKCIFKDGVPFLSIKQ
jgi:adenine-specific DNA-methyltransferase